MNKSTPNSLAKKPLRVAVAEVSATEITVQATYTSAIGIDVHLNLLVCTVQVQLDNHQELTESRDFYTNRDDLDKFAAWCKSKNPQIILMESTGSLWYSVYESLEDVGFTDKELVLINARDAKAASVILDAKLRNTPDLALVIANAFAVLMKKFILH